MATEPLVSPNAISLPPIAGSPAAPAQAPPDSASFRRLLESLEKLTREHREVPPVADADQMQDVIKRVDDGFTTAMDLRKKLEEAFRGRLP
jgi:hypothetical protein